MAPVDENQNWLRGFDWGGWERLVMQAARGGTHWGADDTVVGVAAETALAPSWRLGSVRAGSREME